MPRFYHLDRLRRLNEGETIELVKYNDVKILGGNKESSQRLQSHCDYLFPDGFSNHGEAYFLKGKSPLDKDPYLEIFFEYVRRSSFQDKPSRFQSFFAVDNLDDITTFQKYYGDGNVFEVECERYFKADMGLLHTQTSILSLSYMVHNYWSGISDNPQPLWEYLLIPPVRIIKHINA